jgi:hypothetical protein
MIENINILTDCAGIETYPRTEFTHVILAVTKEKRYFFTNYCNSKMSTKLYTR